MVIITSWVYFIAPTYSTTITIVHNAVVEGIKSVLNYAEKSTFAIKMDEPMKSVCHEAFDYSEYYLRRKFITLVVGIKSIAYNTTAAVADATWAEPDWATEMSRDIGCLWA
jgi:hypothetical protein